MKSAFPTAESSPFAALSRDGASKHRGFEVEVPR
jgi:hypothetical protein